jgi:hypothetical protein
MIISKALTSFQTAVEQMKRTVLVPQQLDDMKYIEDRTTAVGLPTIPSPCDGGSRGSSNSSAIAIIRVEDREPMPVLEDPSLLICYRLLDSIYDDVTNGFSMKTAGVGMKLAEDGRLFRGDGSNGSPGWVSQQPVREPQHLSGSVVASERETSFDRDVYGEDSVADLVRQQARNFVGALEQLTELANTLSRRYEERIDNVA